MPETYEFKLLIHCENFPGATFGEITEIRLGLQKAKSDEVVEEVSGDSESATFAANAKARRKDADGEPVFTGEFVAGGSEDRHIRLKWEGWNGEERVMFRRIKVPLKGIGWDMIMRSVDGGKPVEAIINLTDAKGAPAAATLKEPMIRWMR